MTFPSCRFVFNEYWISIFPWEEREEEEVGEGGAMVYRNYTKRKTGGELASMVSRFIKWSAEGHGHLPIRRLLRVRKWEERQRFIVKATWVHLPSSVNSALGCRCWSCTWWLTNSRLLTPFSLWPLPPCCVRLGFSACFDRAPFYYCGTDHRWNFQLRVFIFNFEVFFFKLNETSPAISVGLFSEIA